MAQITDRVGPKDFEKMPTEYRDLQRLLTMQADSEIGGPHPKRRTDDEARRHIAEVEPKIAALDLDLPDRRGRQYL